MSTTKTRAARKRAPAKAPSPPRKAVTSAVANRSTIQEKVVLLIVTIRAPGNNRQVSDKTILETDAQKHLLRVSKRLIEADEHRAIQTMDGQVRQYVRSMALPSPFKEGVYALPLALLEQVDAQLSLYHEVRQTLVQDLAAAYTGIVERSKATLGSLFKQSDYLTSDQLDAAYTLEWQYVTIAAPEVMRGTALFERENERLTKQWEEAIGDMRDAIRIGLSELVNDLVARLPKDSAPRANGYQSTGFKPGKLLERFDEFLSNFKARNVTDDTSLNALADQARSLLAGVDAKTLRDAKDVRGQVATGFKEVQVKLQELEVESRAKRRITFDEE